MARDASRRFPGCASVGMAAKPPGSRIVSVEVIGANGDYAPIDPDAIYSLASNDFMRQGGDEYTVFADHAIDPYDYGQSAGSGIGGLHHRPQPDRAAADGRITRVDGQ